MLPDRNLNGQIEAIQVRLDKVYNQKFYNLKMCIRDSSKRKRSWLIMNKARRFVIETPLGKLEVYACLLYTSLPSVGAGNVLREMIRSEKVPTAVLETVCRQASNSRIITNAHAINHNDTHLQDGDDFQMLEVQNSEEAARLVIKNYLREVAIHGIENVQILSPFRKRGAVVDCMGVGDDPTIGCLPEYRFQNCRWHLLATDHLP